VALSPAAAPGPVLVSASAGVGTDMARDPQGGRFHLLAGEADWPTCPEPAPEHDPAWPVRTVLADVDGHLGNFEWDRMTGSLRLAHREAVARRPAHGAVRRPEERRGADRDRYGSWYWIDANARGIVRLGHEARNATSWWSLDDLSADCSTATSSPGGGGDFVSVPEPVVGDDARLAGLAITTAHYLLVGLVDTQGGLVLFDLHSRGVPRVLRWPGGHAITPFDLAATSGGGVLVLDRVRRSWWCLDRVCRLEAAVVPGPPAIFQPDPTDPTDQGAAACPPPPASVIPRAHLLDAAGPRAVVDPVAIAEGPDAVLVLDRPISAPSAVVLCDPRTGTVTARLPLTVDALDPTRPDLPGFTHDVVGQDLAWGPAGTTQPLPGPLVYVADASTSGTEAYQIVLDGGGEPAVVHRPDELPMRSWDAKALVAVGGDVFYDAVGRWIPLEPFGVCNRERAGVLRTPTGFDAGAVPGQPFDSGTPGCVWHRLFLDAELPDGCALTVGVRAADDPELLERLPFVHQPAPYLRGGGAELPFHDPWAGVQRPGSERTGTWELLFQRVTGRYLQLELGFAGTGRTSPSLRALRAWFPRFSYVHAYLPEPYQADDEPARFLERMLANMEGLLTEHERRIENAWMLVDPRTTPAAAIDWLASWMGLRLEPQWTTERRRFLLRNVHRLYRVRGTVGGLRALLRLYLGCSLSEDVVFAPQPRPDDPVRIVEPTSAHRFKVLVPFALDDDQATMVGRIVEAARPAHAGFEVRWRSGLLVVGEAQLGIDTVLGDTPRHVPLEIGQTPLAVGVLAADHPFEVADRIVSDRDRLGELPGL
jgi:phage tail-like protein